MNFSRQPIFAIDTTFFVDDRFTKADIRYLFYLLGSLGLDHVSKDSAVPGLDRNDAYQRIVAFPTNGEEQSTIAQFLDYLDRRIGRYIRAKQKLIALLNEQKQAIIHRAVTRGLDPDVRLKPSGVESLGEVPEHWKVRRLQHVLAQRTRNGLYKGPDEYSEDGTPIVQMREAFTSPTVSRAANDRVRLSDEERNRWMLSEGDLLFARRSLVFEGSGKCSIVGELPEPHVFESSLIRVRLDIRQVLPRFLFCFFRSGFSRSQVLAVTKQVTISGIDGQQLKLLTVVVSPIEEQGEIVSDIERQSEPLNRTIEKVAQQIQAAREYQTCIVVDVVTGKLDVREAAARLPEEPAAGESVEDTELGQEAEVLELDLDAAPEEVEA